MEAIAIGQYNIHRYCASHIAWSCSNVPCGERLFCCEVHYDVHIYIEKCLSAYNSDKDCQRNRTTKGDEGANGGLNRKKIRGRCAESSRITSTKRNMNSNDTKKGMYAANARQTHSSAMSMCEYGISVRHMVDVSTHSSIRPRCSCKVVSAKGAGIQRHVLRQE